MSTTPDIPNDDDDAAFWGPMRAAMLTHGRPAGARMPRAIDPAAIRRRAARECETEQRVIRTTWWARAGWISAAAAGLALAVLALRESSAGPIDGVTNERLAAIEAQLAAVTSQRDALADASNEVFTEDGSAVVIPVGGPEAADSYMPIRVVNHIDAAAPTNTVVANRTERPWLGVWTRPVTITGLEQNTGMSVVRVAQGSPAARAGIQPGDVIVDLAGCPLATRFCILKVLQDYRPGEQIPLGFFRPGTEGVQQVAIDLAGAVE